jgi:hypothetical protein
VKCLLIIQAFAFHQSALGPFDQAAGVKGCLELVGQGTLELRLGCRAEQAGHHAGLCLATSPTTGNRDDLGIKSLFLSEPDD